MFFQKSKIWIINSNRWRFKLWILKLITQNLSKIYLNFLPLSSRDNSKNRILYLVSAILIVLIFSNIKSFQLFLFYLFHNLLNLKLCLCHFFFFAIILVPQEYSKFREIITIFIFCSLNSFLKFLLLYFFVIILKLNSCFIQHIQSRLLGSLRTYM